jgi:hypothetical protein
MKNVIVTSLVLGLLGGVALAQPYVVRGDFNGWGGSGDLALSDMGGGMYSGTAMGLTPGQTTEYKATTPDWSFNAPGSNGKTVANAAGEITFNFFPATSWADGWKPDTSPRVGYADPGQFGWEIIGSFDGWTNPLLPLANQGSGLYAGDIAIAPGSYEFKFRKAGDWGISIGGDFGNSAGNAAVTVNAGDPAIRFELDLPNGRWRTQVVPEPGALVLLALGLLLRRR